MAYRIQQRRDTAARWAEMNPILLDGEMGLVTDNPNQYKIGDGVHTWNELPLRGYTGTISQEFGEREDAVVSQKVVSEKFSETEQKLSDIGSKVVELSSLEISNIINTPENVAGSRIPIGQTLKVGETYLVEIEFDIKTGFLGYIGANTSNSGAAVDRVASIFSNVGTVRVEYIPSADVTYWYIAPSTNYVYTEDSYVRIKAFAIKGVQQINENVAVIQNNISQINERVEHSEQIIGKLVVVNEHPSYKEFHISVLKKGSKITNNGVPILVAEDSSLTGRQDIPSGATVVLESDKNYAKTLNVTGDVRFIYMPIETVEGSLLKGNSIEGDKLKNKSITPEKTVFFSSENLINKNDEDVQIGYYLTTGSNLSQNSSYNTTGYIPVDEDRTYFIGSSDKGVQISRFLKYYDSKKNPTSIFEQNISPSFVVPKGVSFVRLTLYANSWDNAQLTEGEMLPYQEYKVVVKSEFLPNRTDEKPELFFYLPKNIYVAAGRTIELYYEQILLGAEKYHIQAVCSVGKSLDRKFQIIGSESKVGSHTLTINVYNDEGEYVIGGTATIHIVSSEIENSLKVLPIGDSLTNGKQWLYELSRLSSNITTVGTRQSIHEGRSGGTVSTYTNVSGSEVYSYDPYYRGRGSDSELFSDSKAYSKGDIVRVASTAGNGQQGYDVYVFLEDHPSGAWNGNDVYCINKGNPFYDYNNKKFSMSFYKTFQGISYDLIMIYLGTNGISLTPEINENGALGIKTLIELIREEDTETPIVVVNTIFRSSQNGIGNQGNTDGYKAQSAYKFEEDKKVLLLAKAVEEMVSGMDGVYLCPVGFTHDSKYNFGNTHIQVNPRLTDTSEVYELQPLDSVHPQECGYLQMADEMFSTICAVD